MPKRRKFSGESLCKLLEENGFFAVRQRGSHRMMQKVLPAGTISVSVKRHHLFFKLLAKSLTAKSWGRKTAKIYSRYSPQKMILLSMILLKKPLLKSKHIRESQKGNRLKLDSNISKI